MIGRSEAVRLTRSCLPEIRRSGVAEVARGLEDELSEKDVDVKSLCRLWAG